MKKKIVRLSPAAIGLEASERHYLDRHFRFASETFERSVPAVIAYHANHAVGQFDLCGGFGEVPDVWRFVVTQWDDAGDGGHAVGWLEPRVRDLFFLDRVKCIGDVSSTEVDEQVVIDRRSGQTALVKYVFRYAPAQFGPRHEFERYYADHHLPALVAAAATSVGPRLLLSDIVAREAETAERPDGHTEYTGGYIDHASTYCFEEYWFDGERQAAAFFGSDEVLGLLRDSPFGKVLGYRVTEVCGIDRR